MNLENKHVIVTGGSRGLGLGLVEALVVRGAKVSVVARDSQVLEPIKRRLGVAVVSADVTDQAKAHRILSDLKPDILVLNAGVPRAWQVWIRSLGKILVSLGRWMLKPDYIGCRLRSIFRQRPKAVSWFYPAAQRLVDLRVLADTAAQNECYG